MYAGSRYNDICATAASGDAYKCTLLVTPANAE